jgi:hypothetical protein
LHGGIGGVSAVTTSLAESTSKGGLSPVFLIFIRPIGVEATKLFVDKNDLLAKTIINSNVIVVAESALLFTIIQLQVSYLHIRLHETPLRRGWRGFPERYLFYSKNPNRFIGPLGALEKSLDLF